VLLVLLVLLAAPFEELLSVELGEDVDEVDDELVLLPPRLAELVVD
jgi:hypothetical protein